MSTAEWTRQAEQDLRDIFRFIAVNDNRPEIARKIVHEIRRHCNEYATAFAGGNIIGSIHQQLNKRYRTFSHKRWVVLFRPTETSILVIAVVDGHVRGYGFVEASDLHEELHTVTGQNCLHELAQGFHPVAPSSTLDARLREELGRNPSWILQV